MDVHREWRQKTDDFTVYLKIEKALSENTVEAYLDDVGKLRKYICEAYPEVCPHAVTSAMISEFLVRMGQSGMQARSQARTLSGVRAFYKFMLMDNVIDADPARTVDHPKIGIKLPDVLAVEEIDALLAAIDLSKPAGQRNKTMLETMYSCGLRVSELVSLRLSDLYLKEGFIRVRGKGSKERLIPVSDKAIHEIGLYLPDRAALNIAKGYEDCLFLSARGKTLTRVMVFTIIRDLTKAAGISKHVSPHTFRHSFATHLMEGGADLRAVQEMLGHESIITTEIYTHLDRSFLRQTLIEFHPRSRTGRNLKNDRDGQQ
ncbi:MAG: site-specific tyrosine recombinase XerD [Bacteroidales bacterium]|jgi:integrase/recombinase XerD|nr:site-specific tyrosine recombinase XerD [Bacteroidales bacterium]